MVSFTRKAEPAAEPTISGTDALRMHLRSRIERPSGTSCARIAADICDDFNAAAAKAKARSIADSMLPGGDEIAIKALANSLIGTIDVKTTIITGQRLEQFAYGTINLDPIIKNGLANFLHGGNVIYDAARDLLDSAHRHQPQTLGVAPGPWCHPNPRIAAAADALRDAMATTIRSPLRTPTPSTLPSHAAAKPRPGFA
ncbi:hypothetical protein [Bradyrhizobium sp. 604_D8_N2_3]|uniref:hypothetical protein n=1 Tax=Bradyrhizobium sp. 604_D8_N2_3 TaxID=3240370 RepID=UPI003F20DD48